MPHKLNLNKAQEVLSLNVTSSLDRPRVMSVAVAAAIAGILEIPAGAVEDTNFYTFTHQKEARRMVSEVNELYTVDTVLTLSFVEAFYMMRCNVAFPKMITKFPGPKCVLAYYSDSSRYLNKEQEALLDEFNPVITRCIGHVAAFFNRESETTAAE